MKLAFSATINTETGQLLTDEELDKPIAMWSVEHFGGKVILPTAQEVGECIQYEENEGAEYKCTLIYMTRRQYAELPEFDGF